MYKTSMTEAGSRGRVSFSFSLVQNMTPADLLKLATIMGMGRVIQSTPQIAQRDPTNFPPAVVGAMSPYPASAT